MNIGDLLSETELPLDVSELGELQTVMQECPGVFYLAVKDEADLDLLPTEYYLVLEDAPISKEARSYGKPFQNDKGLVFTIGEDNSGDKIIEYEIYKYLVSQHLPLPEGISLHSQAVYGAEIYPDYFGMLPVDRQTPWGYTTRYKALDSGIYWIETDQCEEVLAVSYPAWNSDLSESVLNHACHLPYDIEQNIDNTLGYKFFKKKDSCIVIFELLQTHPNWLTNGHIGLPELMNAIWTYFPEYAMNYNVHEQAGLNDALGQLLKMLGIDVELKKSEEKMIKLNSDVGVDFFHWS